MFETGSFVLIDHQGLPVKVEAGRVYVVLQSRVVVQTTRGGIGGSPVQPEAFYFEHVVQPEEV